MWCLGSLACAEKKTRSWVCCRDQQQGVAAVAWSPLPGRRKQMENGHKMTSREFCYWLQGFFEINFDCEPGAAPEGLTPEQTGCIRRHLSMVFKHEIDPSYPNQSELGALHEGKAPPTLAELYKLLEEERPKIKKDLEELLEKNKTRPGNDPLIRC